MTSTGQAPRSGPGAARPDLRYVVFIAAVASMGGFLFGYDSAVVNGIVAAIRSGYAIGSAALAQVIAVTLIGSAIGAVIAGRIADRIGRVRCMRIAAVLFTVGAINAALPFALWEFVLWRIVTGFAIGVALVVGPVYIAEIAPPAYRGRLGSFQQAAIVVGYAISKLVNWGLLTAAGGDQRGHLMGLEVWQVMLGVMVVPAVL
ncbi:MAG: MFS transporter, partial [Kitasatospora sp.]|nr:MFS transporter [Kitasatospora sp.]